MKINKQCIIRLSRYKNALYRLKNLGFVKVFSDNLADAVGSTSAQVRKDFSLFGISGNRRGGYQMDTLLEKLNNILGKDKLQKTIVAGAGNIGSALIGYRGFEKEGIDIVAGFDIDSALINEKAETPIFSLSKLKDFVKHSKIEIGIIAVPDSAAQEVLDLMVEGGIKGVLNFAPISLRAPEHIVINNVNLGIELENLIYFVNAVERTGSRE